MDVSGKACAQPLPTPILPRKSWPRAPRTRNADARCRPRNWRQSSAAPPLLFAAVALTFAGAAATLFAAKARLRGYSRAPEGTRRRGAAPAGGLRDVPAKEEPAHIPERLSVAGEGTGRT
eukprot:gene15434-7217_t